jgi:3-hydroxyisobutyrate dehydrogenase-like beta-hydroxyacid dehydrogenase
MICLLGFGEVGQTFAEDLRTGFTAWDIKFNDLASIPSKAAARLGVSVPASVQEAVAQADVVVCAVTAAQDKAAAESVAKLMKPGAFFMDVNSASPGQKKEAAAVIEAAGGRYVEAVIMSPIGNKRLASPVLLGGPHARVFLPIAQSLGFSGASFYGDELGLASATKLCRSVIVKGMEALLTESMLAARHYRVEQAVLDSMQDFFPGAEWEKLARYMISRAVQHGTRRAEEMREAAHTVADAGLAPRMSSATAELQDWAASFKDALQYDELPQLLDALRAGSGCETKE